MAAAIPRIKQALKDAIANPAAASPIQAAAQLGALSAGNAEQQVVAELAQEVSRLCRDFDYWRRGRGLEDVLIEEVELGARTYSALKRAGINTLADLMGRSESDLAAYQI